MPSTVLCTFISSVSWNLFQQPWDKHVLTLISQVRKAGSRWLNIQLFDCTSFQFCFLCYNVDPQVIKVFEVILKRAQSWVCLTSEKWKCRFACLIPSSLDRKWLKMMICWWAAYWITRFINSFIRHHPIHFFFCYNFRLSSHFSLLPTCGQFLSHSHFSSI